MLILHFALSNKIESNINLRISSNQLELESLGKGPNYYNSTSSFQSLYSEIDETDTIIGLQITFLRN